MTLSAQDRELIRLIVEEVLTGAMPRVIELHVQSCPHGKMLARNKAFLAGLCVGLFGIGAGTGGLLVKVLMG